MDNYAKFWKCALQVNPWTYAQQYQGNSHGLTENDYNHAVADRCIENEIKVVGIADHGSVDGVDNLRRALEEKGIVVFPGFEIASTEKGFLAVLCGLHPLQRCARCSAQFSMLAIIEKRRNLDGSPAGASFWGNVCGPEARRMG